MTAKGQRSCDPRRLVIKELAAELKGPDGQPRSRGYVHAMKLAGFRMPGGMATVSEAQIWLAANPEFTWRSVYVTRKFVPRRDPERMPFRVF